MNQRATVVTPSPADRAPWSSARSRVLAQSIAAVLAYVASAAFQAALIRSVRPTE